MFIADYMSKDPVTIGERDSLSSAQTLMRNHRIRHLPVVDSARRLVGIISDRDINVVLGMDKTLPEKVDVADSMTAEPVTIRADATLDEAVAVMATKRYGAFPVVRGAALVGIITRGDVLRAFRSLLGLQHPGIRLEIALPERQADLVHAFQSLPAHEEVILSAVVSAMRRDGAEPVLYLRVTPESALDVQRRLRESALILLKPEQP